MAQDFPLLSRFVLPAICRLDPLQRCSSALTKSVLPDAACNATLGLTHEHCGLRWDFVSALVALLVDFCIVKFRSIGL